MKKSFLIIGSVFLLIGIIIYLLFRDDILLFSLFQKSTLLNIILDFFRIPLIEDNVNSFLIYNLPDGLWFFSLLLIQFYFYNPLSHFSRLLLLLSILLPFTLEIMQFFHFIKGTFDIIDLAIFFIVLIIFFFIIKFSCHEKYKKNMGYSSHCVN